MTQSRSEDEREIVRLSYNYARALDRNLPQLLVDQFTEDGEFVGARHQLRGHGEIAGFPAIMERFVSTRHLVHNQVVSISGAEARGEVYSTAYHVVAKDAGFETINVHVRYLDDYKKTPAGWKFARRTVAVDFEDRAPVEKGPHGPGDKMDWPLS